MKHFRAPWSLSLKLISLLATVTLLGINLGVWFTRNQMPDFLFWQSLAVPAVVLLVSACFTIRGYAIEPDAILVQRLFWATRLPRTGLKTARFEPNALRGSIRTFGNGALFSFTGLYRNKELHSYRAFVTDPRQTVVLEFLNRRTVVLSPEPPEEFIRELGQAAL